MWFLKVIGAIGSIFTGPKSNPKVIETATNGVVNALDKLVFTNEEFKETQQKAVETILDFQKVYAIENSAQSMARRHLAFLITYFFLACCIAYIVFKMVGWPVEATKDVIEILSTAFTAVMLTYFVPHQVSKIFSFQKK